MENPSQRKNIEVPPRGALQGIERPIWVGTQRHHVLQVWQPQIAIATPVASVGSAASRRVSTEQHQRSLLLFQTLQGTPRLTSRTIIVQPTLAKGDRFYIGDLSSAEDDADEETEECESEPAPGCSTSFWRWVFGSRATKSPTSSSSSAAGSSITACEDSTKNTSSDLAISQLNTMWSSRVGQGNQFSQRAFQRTDGEHMYRWPNNDGSAYDQSHVWQAKAMLKIANEILQMARDVDLGLQGFKTCNFQAALLFVMMVQSLMAQDASLAIIECVYHWTHRTNIQRIIDNGLLVPGELTADGEEVEVRHRESYGRGIYAATELNFGRSFGGKRPCAFLCLCVAGHVQEVCSRTVDIKWKNDHVPGSVRRGALRMYRRSNQVLPLFITDATHDGRLKRAADRIAEHLSKQLKATNLLSFRTAHCVHSSTGDRCGYPGFWQLPIAPSTQAGVPCRDLVAQ